MRLVNQNRTGVFSAHDGAEFRGAEMDCCRLTIPASEALLSAGAVIEPANPPMVQARLGGEWEPDTRPHYRVSLRQQCPPGLVVCQIINGSHALCIRRHDEPEWPGGEAPAMWEQLDLTPCPICGGALVWYEAGYVPGYRVCAGPEHHHWLAR